MIQTPTDAKNSEPKPTTNAYGVKMLQVKTGKKEAPKKPKVYGSSNNYYEQDVIHGDVTLQMIFLVDIPNKKTKCTSIQRSGTTEKVSLIVQETYMYVFDNDPVNLVKLDGRTNDEDATFDNVNHVEPNIDPNVELNVETYGLTSGDSQAE